MTGNISNTFGSNMAMRHFHIPPGGMRSACYRGTASQWLPLLLAPQELDQLQTILDTMKQQIKSNAEDLTVSPPALLLCQISDTHPIQVVALRAVVPLLHVGQGKSTTLQV